MDLLRVICSGSLPSLATFDSDSTKSDLLTKHGIALSDLQHAMKLLTLCSLGSAEATISYAKIAKALSIPVQDVEVTVVEAISLGLIDATMDQFTATVAIR